MLLDKALLREYRIKRLQRVIEYALVFALFFFFLLAFYSYYRLPIVIGLAILFGGMNFQLTQQRERRRLGSPRNRKLLFADMVESILFLGLIILLGLPGVTAWLFGATEREHYALIAGILCGIFAAGMAGEVWFQLRRLPRYDEEQQRNYVKNLKRTIILPYFRSRRQG